MVQISEQYLPGYYSPLLVSSFKLFDPVRDNSHVRKFPFSLTSALNDPNSADTQRLTKAVMSHIVTVSAEWLLSERAVVCCTGGSPV